MSPLHTQLAARLEEESLKYGSRSALARALGIHHTAVGAIINGKRFVTKEQAWKIEKLLNIPAKELWLEAMGIEFDEWLAKEDGK
jgi:plasmid maintenance system antidote protein VapI